MGNIISASRRTDLIRCHPDKLSVWMQAGKVLVPNPFSKKTREVSLLPNDVHTLVLWSKDFSSLLDNRYGIRKQLEKYSQIICQFTITGLGNTYFEPGIITWQQACQQLYFLAKWIGNPERIIWRFDPIVFWQEAKKIKTNLDLFELVGKEVEHAKIKYVAVSICHWYAKAQARAKKAGIQWIQPDEIRIKKAVKKLLEVGKKYGFELSACSDLALHQAGMKLSKCIDGKKFSDLHPIQSTASSRKDQGQRRACGCSESVEIGDYRMGCDTACVYCYARPNSKSGENNA